MKRFASLTFLISVFYVGAFAQANNSKTDSTKPESELLLAQFNDKDNEWNKLAVSLIMNNLLKNPAAVGLIRLRKDKNFKRRLDLLKTALIFMNADLSRINLLIVDVQKYDTDVLAIANCAEMPECENCILIRATDIDKIEKLFRPKINKSRKK